MAIIPAAKTGDTAAVVNKVNKDELAFFAVDRRTK